jgi:hypothetical protein
MNEFTSLLEQAIAASIQTNEALWATTRHGSPSIAFYKESHQTSYWLAWQQVCGHTNTHIIIEDGDGYAQREHQLTGPIVAQYTRDEALAAMVAYVKTIPAKRETLISEIQPGTLRALLDGTLQFPNAPSEGRTPPNPHHDWTGGELTLARQILRAHPNAQKAWRTIDFSQDELLQCVCNAHRRSTSSYAPAPLAASYQLQS